MPNTLYKLSLAEMAFAFFADKTSVMQFEENPSKVVFIFVSLRKRSISLIKRRQETIRTKARSCF